MYILYKFHTTKNCFPIWHEKLKLRVKLFLNLMNFNIRPELVQCFSLFLNMHKIVGFFFSFVVVFIHVIFTVLSEFMLSRLIIAGVSSKSES